MVNKQHAFTLIEILSVIGLMALLLAISIRFVPSDPIDKKWDTLFTQTIARARMEAIARQKEVAIVFADTPSQLDLYEVSEPNWLKFYTITLTNNAVLVPELSFRGGEYDQIGDVRTHQNEDGTPQPYWSFDRNANPTLPGAIIALGDTTQTHTYQISDEGALLLQP